MDYLYRENYEKLAQAIILQAVRDYRNMQKKQEYTKPIKHIFFLTPVAVSTVQVHYTNFFVQNFGNVVFHTVVVVQVHEFMIFDIHLQ